MKKSILIALSLVFIAACGKKLSPIQERDTIIEKNFKPFLEGISKSKIDSIKVNSVTSLTEMKIIDMQLQEKLRQCDSLNKEFQEIESKFKKATALQYESVQEYYKPDLISTSKNLTAQVAEAKNLQAAVEHADNTQRKGYLITMSVYYTEDGSFGKVTVPLPATKDYKPVKSLMALQN